MQVVTCSIAATTTGKNRRYWCTCDTYIHLSLPLDPLTVRVLHLSTQTDDRPTLKKVFNSWCTRQRESHQVVRHKSNKEGGTLGWGHLQGSCLLSAVTTSPFSFSGKIARRLHMMNFVLDFHGTWEQTLSQIRDRFYCPWASFQKTYT